MVIRWKMGRRSRVLVVRLLALGLLITVIWFIRRQQNSLTDRLAYLLPDYIEPDDCNDYPDLGNIAVVVKTGATEAGRLIPTLLKTSLRCVKNPIIVSDLEQEIAGVKIHNVLADFAPRAMEKNSDFDIYHLQHRYQAEGREKDIPRLANMPLTENNWRTPGKSAAWGLDKYKNIRMVELAWRLQPDREWYVFVDADTYLIWNNLLPWLSSIDHKKMFYLGQPVRMREHKPKSLDFAYGGAGIILSHAAVRTYAEERPGLVQRWDRRIQGWWFGDFMLADALDEELDLSVTDGTPMLSGDSPASMAYGPYNWCRPVVSVHHLTPRDAKALYKLERTAGAKKLLGKDVYHGISHDSLPRLQHDWDNKAADARFSIPLDSDLSSFAHKSLEACEAACQSESRCFQYLFAEHVEKQASIAVKADGTCFLSSVFRLGEERQAEVSGDKIQIQKTWTSGWNSVRIVAWTLSNTDCQDIWMMWQFGPGVIADGGLS